MPINKINSTLENWNNAVLNKMDDVTVSNRSPFAKACILLPFSGAAVITSVATTAAETFHLLGKLPLAGLKYGVIGSIRLFTWSKAFDSIDMRLPDGKSLLKTLIKVCRKALGIFFSLIGLAFPRFNLRWQEKLGNFVKMRKAVSNPIPTPQALQKPVETPQKALEEAIELTAVKKNNVRILPKKKESPLKALDTVKEHKAFKKVRFSSKIKAFPALGVKRRVHKAKVSVAQETSAFAETIKVAKVQELDFLQAFQIAEKSNTSLPPAKVIALPDTQVLAETKSEPPAGLVSWAKNHPLKATAAAIGVTVLGIAAAYGARQLLAPGFDKLVDATQLIPAAPGNVTVSALKPVLEARPLELPKEWLVNAPLPVSPLTPPFDVGTSPAPIAKMELAATSKLQPSCPIPNPYEWPAIGNAPIAVEPATHSYLDSALGTLKWVGTAATIVSLAAATAPFFVPAAAGGAVIAGIGAAATTISLAARGADAISDVSDGNYGEAAFTIATMGAGPALGAMGSLLGNAGHAGAETMSIGARVFNDPARMRELAGEGWRLVDLGARGAQYLRSGNAATNFLMSGGRFILEKLT